MIPAQAGPNAEVLMLDLLDRVPSHDVTGVLFAVIAGFATLGIFIARYWAKVRRTEIEAALKHDMLQRGLGAEDIERVLRASQAPAEPAATSAPAGDTSPAALAGVLADNSYEGDDIAAILKAVAERDAPLSAAEFAVVRKLAEEGYEGDDVVTTIRALPRPAPTPAAAPEAKTVEGVIPRGFVGLGAVIVSKKRPEESAAPTPG
jgi:hypothetical protein